MNKKFVTSRNTINLNKINQLKLDDSEKFEKQHQSVLVRINNGDISSVPFKEDDFKIVTAGRLSLALTYLLMHLVKYMSVIRIQSYILWEKALSVFN